MLSPDGRVAATAESPHALLTPRPGWTEQRPEDLAQLLGRKQRRVSRAAEHAPEGFGIGAGSDAQTQTADSVTARFAEL